MKASVQITLENEMDVLLGNKRAMRFGNILNLSLTTRTAFAVAVSEVCREVTDLTNKGVLELGVKEEDGRYFLFADVTYPTVYDMDVSEERLMYAKRLVSNFVMRPNPGQTSTIEIRLTLPREMRINNRSIQQLQNDFETDSPVNEYEEIKRKNLLLSKLNIEQEIELQKTKTINERKDEFISVASHEMLTPLTTVKAYLHLLEETINPANISALSFAKKTSVSVNRLNKLISELLDVSKIQNGKLDFTYSSFDFNALLNETIDDLRSIWPQFTFIKKENEVEMITGDKDRLQQVIINIIGNAIKYSPENSEIWISMERNEEELLVTVKDFGAGISENDLNKIFERYFRSQDHTKKFSGLGIGLFVSSEIIHRHNGRIWAESTQGKGSTFYFTVPVNHSLS